MGGLAKKTAPFDGFIFDAAGMVPGFGEFFDLANAGMYVIERDNTKAGISAAVAIPFAGWLATGAKWGDQVRTLVKLGDEGLTGFPIWGEKCGIRFQQEHGHGKRRQLR